jgi:hypothetical protein
MGGMWRLGWDLRATPCGTNSSCCRVGVLIGLVAGVIAFGVPASAAFGNAGDRVVGWVMLVPILVCGVVGGYVALVLAARNG